MASLPNGSTDRRTQILRTAMGCFARHGLHQTSMHDISDAAGISVGLIYRYFESKEQVIAALADEHKKEIRELLARARHAPTLLDALELFFTAHCCADQHQIEAAFVVDLFAEGARNPRIAKLVRGVLDELIDGVADLIARSGGRVTNALSPHETAELIFATARGMLMRDVIAPQKSSYSARREAQLDMVRSLWRLLFDPQPALV